MLPYVYPVGHRYVLLPILDAKLKSLLRTFKDCEFRSQKTDSTTNLAIVRLIISLKQNKPQGQKAELLTSVLT